MDTKQTSFNEKISFTADGVAYRRTFTDIPYCREIFTIMEEICGPLSPREKQRADEHKAIIPFFEARYLLTDREIKKSGVTQVMELASGLSPRGLIMTENPAITYVELDLPEKMEFKREVIRKLHRNRPAESSNLILEDGNAVDVRDFAFAEMKLRVGPVAVVCEGLLRYLNWEDKEELANNVKGALGIHGGVWITSDIELLSEVESSPEKKARYDKITREWGLDVRPNLFRDIKHAISFFEGFGFKVAQHSTAEVSDSLTCPKRLGLSDESVRVELSKHSAFVLSL